MKDQSMKPEISDETLMAFADGALDEPQFSAVAEALEVDEALALRLERLVEGADLARQGFEHLLTPVPPELVSEVTKAIRTADRKPFWAGFNISWLYPVGAVGFAAITLAVMMPALQHGMAGPGLSPLAELSGPEMASALDTLASGTAATLTSGTSVTAIASFEDGSGTLCREFETEGPAPYIAVACRTEPGWSVRLALSQTAADGSYSPASGLDTLDAFLTSIGAGASLLDAEERAALVR